MTTSTVSTITLAQIVESVRAAKTAVTANENTFIGELRCHASNKTNQQNIAYFLNVMSVMDLAGLAEIVRMLTAHTNLQIVDGSKPETKVNSHGNLFASRKDEGYADATTYKIAFKQKLADENTGLQVGPWDSLYALHSGFKSAPKQRENQTSDEHAKAVREWERRRDFLTAFLAGEAVTVALANGEEDAVVIEAEQYNGSLIELASAIKKAARKAKAEKDQPSEEEKKAKAKAKRAERLAKLLAEIAEEDGSEVVITAVATLTGKKVVLMSQEESDAYGEYLAEASRESAEHDREQFESVILPVLEGTLTSDEFAKVRAIDEFPEIFFGKSVDEAMAVASEIIATPVDAE